MADAVGPDLSAHQTHTPSLADQDFVIARGAYGDFTDQLYPQHGGAARKRGIPLGAYLFARDQDAGDQVRALLAARPVPDFYAVDYERDVGHPTSASHPIIRQCVAKLKTTGRKVLLYATPSTAFDAGQDGDWLAAPGQMPLPGHWLFRQHQSGVPGGNNFNGSAADLRGWLGVTKLRIIDTKAHVIGLPSGITVYDLGGHPAHPISTPRDERSDLLVTVGDAPVRFYVIPTALGGDPAVGLVRALDVNDKGAPQGGGASAADVAAAHAAGFAEARDKAVAAVQSI